MITLTEILKGKVVICRTEEEAMEFAQIIDTHGYRFIDGSRLVLFTFWSKYKNETCYELMTDRDVAMADKWDYEHRFKKEIITYQEFKQLIKKYNMETKEFKVQVPEGYEIDRENSTFECIKFNLIEKVMTYKDVIDYFFNNEELFFVDYLGGINNIKDGLATIVNSYISSSKKQAEKLLAINKLMNVAKYLNGDWHPDWDQPQEKKYYIKVDAYPYDLKVDFNLVYRDGNIYFKSEELAKQAIEILGEDTIRLALSTDW